MLREYERRDREIPADYYALHHPVNLFFRQGRERAILQALRSAGLTPLAQRRILEIGCGRGEWFGMFRDFGMIGADIAGIDLSDRRVREARQRFPEADVRCGDASRLPWPDEFFDVVFQSTVFTSILDAEARRAVAAEMLRVLKPSGIVLWYDFRYDNPGNTNVRGVTYRDIQSLFPGCRVATWNVTLAPPIARRVVPWSWSAAVLLEMTKLFNTHYVAVIVREGANPVAGRAAS
jgi:SAM-dependent methyltransferase